MKRTADPITFEVIKYNLDSIADQAAITLFRSAYSAIVRDSLDYSTAVFDGAARMLAQGLTTPMHIGSFPDAMRNLLEKYDGRIYPGRRVHPQRPVQLRRHAPAGRLRHQAGLLRRRARRRSRRR